MAKQGDKTYEMVTLFKTKNTGNVAIAPGRNEIGEEIEWGDMDNPTRAVAKDHINLPKTMDKEELDEWMDRQDKHPESWLNKKRKEIEDKDEDLQEYTLEVEEASITVEAENEEEARRKADGVYSNRHGAKLETHLLREPLR